MLLQKIKKFFLIIKTFIIKIYVQIFEESLSQTKNKKFLFIYFSSIIAILFFLAFYLVKVNPIQLLLPFTVFDFPEIDKRVEKIIYVSDGKGSILKIKRKILLNENDMNRSINILISEISNPSFENKIESNVENVFPKRTLNLVNSLIVKWLVDNNSKIIFDFNQKNLEDELLKIRSKSITDEEETIFDKKTPEDEKRILSEQFEIQKVKLKKLEISFLCLEKTIFENFPSVQTIEFRLNGKSKRIQDLEYILDEIKKR